MFVAAALTAYDNETEEPEDLHKYGELFFEYIGWGEDDETMASYERHVEHHPCSFEELGLSDKPYQHGHGEDDGLEYPIFWESEHEVRLWKKKFKCMKHEDFVIWGNFNTAKAQQVAISFSICEGEGCYDKEKILAWLDTQYIVMLYH